MTMPRFCVVCCGKPGGVTATTSPSRKTRPQLGYWPPPLFAGGISISKLSAPKQQVAQVGISRHKKQLGTACKSHCATYKQTIRLALTQLLHIIKVNKHHCSNVQSNWLATANLNRSATQLLCNSNLTQYMGSKVG